MESGPVMRFWDDATGKPNVLQKRVRELVRMGYPWAVAKETAQQEEFAQKRADELLKGT